jgi:hypothetical protein
VRASSPSTYVAPLDNLNVWGRVQIPGTAFTQIYFFWFTRSLALRTCGKDLAAGVMVKSSAEKSVAMYHVRRSLAGKALRAGPGVVVEASCETSGDPWTR